MSSAGFYDSPVSSSSLLSVPVSPDSAGRSRSSIDITAARCMADGNTSLDSETYLHGHWGEACFLPPVCFPCWQSLHLHSYWSGSRFRLPDRKRKIPVQPSFLQFITYPYNQVPASEIQFSQVVVGHCRCFFSIPNARISPAASFPPYPEILIACAVSARPLVHICRHLHLPHYPVSTRYSIKIPLSCFFSIIKKLPPMRNSYFLWHDSFGYYPVKSGIYLS